MEFNRLVSLVLGFVILILVFVWISNRFRANTRTVDGRAPTITPTYTPTPSTSKTSSRWNPLSFLNRENTSPTTVPSKPSPTGIKVKVENTGIMAQISNTTTPKQASPTVAAKKQPTVKPTNTIAKVQAKQATPVSQTPVYKNNKTGKTLTQIPETGAPSILLPLVLGGLSCGIYLRRRS